MRGRSTIVVLAGPRNGPLAVRERFLASARFSIPMGSPQVRWLTLVQVDGRVQQFMNLDWPAGLFLLRSHHCGDGGNHCEIPHLDWRQLAGAYRPRNRCSWIQQLLRVWLMEAITCGYQPLTFNLCRQWPIPP